MDDEQLHHAPERNAKYEDVIKEVLRAAAKPLLIADLIRRVVARLEKHVVESSISSRISLMRDEGILAQCDEAQDELSKNKGAVVYFSADIPKETKDKFSRTRFVCFKCKQKLSE